MLRTAAKITAIPVAAAAAWGVYTYMTYDYRWWWNKRALSGKEVTDAENWEQTLIHGDCKPGWEKVREEFVHNFRARGELGGAVCIYYRGEKVVDLWGGYRDRHQHEWEKDTLTNVFSTTKGISALAIAMLSSRGKFHYDDKVSTHWPAFGQNGKENVTIRQLLDHSCGLAGPSPPLTLEQLSDKKTVREFFAKQPMEWETPGDYKGYMAITLGYYESALVQMTEGPKQRTIGQYLREEAFIPLGLEDELFIGLPDSIPDARISTIDGLEGLEALWNQGGFPDGLMWKLLMEPNSYTGRAFRNPKLSDAPGVMDYNRRDVKRPEMPAANGHATARAIAKMYACAERAINTQFQDNPLGLSEPVMKSMMKPAQPGRKNGWNDEVIGMDIAMGAGCLLPPTREQLGSGQFCSILSGFGTPGAGGSFGFCDPEAEVAFAYVMNRTGSLIVDDPREFALRTKMYECVQQCRESENDGRNLPRLPLEQLRVAQDLSAKYMDKYPGLKPLSSSSS
jgi:CubicO group peptidase (beta-lactamase class C family)